MEKNLNCCQTLRLEFDEQIRTSDQQQSVAIINKMVCLHKSVFSVKVLEPIGGLTYAAQNRTWADAEADVKIKSKHSSYFARFFQTKKRKYFKNVISEYTYRLNAY